MLDIKTVMRDSHAQAIKSGFWSNPDGSAKERNKGEMIALMHSELSEMLEGVRKNKRDEHLPMFSSETVELADLFIRMADYAEAFCPMLEDAILAKMAYNATRADHKPENRHKDGGKSF